MLPGSLAASQTWACGVGESITAHTIPQDQKGGTSTTLPHRPRGPQGRPPVIRRRCHPPPTPRHLRHAAVGVAGRRGRRPTRRAAPSTTETQGRRRSCYITPAFTLNTTTPNGNLTASLSSQLTNSAFGCVVECYETTTSPPATFDPPCRRVESAGWQLSSTCTVRGLHRGWACELGSARSGFEATSVVDADQGESKLRSLGCMSSTLCTVVHHFIDNRDARSVPHRRVRARVYERPHSKSRTPEE